MEQEDPFVVWEGRDEFAQVAVRVVAVPATQDVHVEFKGETDAMGQASWSRVTNDGAILRALSRALFFGAKP